jgi:hypothetical protein
VESGGLWISEDGGKSWLDKTDVLNGGCSCCVDAASGHASSWRQQSTANSSGVVCTGGEGTDYVGRTRALSIACKRPRAQQAVLWIHSQRIPLQGVIVDFLWFVDGCMRRCKDAGAHSILSTACLCAFPCIAASLPSSEPLEVISVLSKRSDPANIVIIGAGSYYWYVWLRGEMDGLCT